MHKNNFDFLRLLFSIFVMITHSYILTGLEECDPLCKLSGGQTLLSYIGVRAFFIISGYLIFQSLFRSRGLVDYFWKRLLRLYPALAVVVILTILFAPIIYNNPNVSYLKNIQVWTYIPRNLSLFFPQFKIEGIFNNNPYPLVINGTLWTIAYEFTMYIVISSLILFKNRKTLILSILIATYILLLIVNLFFIREPGGFTYILNTNALSNLGLFFISGSILAALNIYNSRYFKIMTILAVIILCHSLFLVPYFGKIQFVVLPVAVIGIGIQKTKIISDTGSKIGDLSYGIYIYGFIVQQVIMYYFKPGYIALMIFSLIITSVIAYFSWHYVELKFLKLKKLDIRNLRLSN